MVFFSKQAEKLKIQFLNEQNAAKIIEGDDLIFCQLLAAVFRTVYINKYFRRLATK